MDYTLVDKYLGYRTLEDKTNMPAGFLVSGSQNVISTPGNRFGKRQGYTIDGQVDNSDAGTVSSFDFETSKGDERNVKVANGKMQYRYIASAGDYWNGTTFTAGQVYWIDLLTGLTSAQEECEFTTFYDFSTEKVTFMLFVNGESNIKEWNPALTTMLSATVNTITKTGTQTWAEAGFNISHNKTVVINGTTYTYTGGETTTTLTGVTPSPAAQVVQSVVHQGILTTANSAMSGLPSTFKNTNIDTLNNQVHLSAIDLNEIYISKTNNYKDYSFSTPRTVGEGARLIIDSPNGFFIAQENEMYISAGRDDWWRVEFEQQTDDTQFLEQANAVPLKTSTGQGAFSQSAIFKVKNSVFFINREPALDELGRVLNNFAVPLVQNYSDPIKPNFDAYDFTGASGVYYKYNIYIAVPAEGLVLIYNIQQEYWEPPQTMPISRFAVIGGELYGHDSGNPQTYKLFTGSNDNGFAIDARAYFSYNNYGTRSRMKTFSDFYLEGYMSGNTDLTTSIVYEIDGCAKTASYTISGDDSQIVCVYTNDASLGKTSLGKNPLGSTTLAQAITPPKFRVDLPFNQNPFYEIQVQFSSNDSDSDWSILAFGPRVAIAPDDNSAIRK